MRLKLDFPVLPDPYKTSFSRSSWFASSFPSLTFYSQMIGTVLQASRWAKRGIYDDSKWCYSSYRILKALESIGTGVHIENVRNLTDLQGPSIIVGNHMSTLETFVLPYVVCPHKKLTFVIKDTLVSYPVFKHVMVSRNPIVVGRNNPKKDFQMVLNEGVRRVEEGYTVVVFPQTTRMLQFDRTKFNSIGVKLAKKANVPVVPLALKTDCWGNGRILKDFGKINPSRTINFEFGKPMKIQNNGKEQQELIIKHIENCLIRWNSNIVKA